MFWSYGYATHHLSGMNRNLGYKAHFEAWPGPEHCSFASLRVVSWIALVLQAGSRVENPITQHFLSSLSNSVCRHKKNVLLLRNVTWYSLPVVSACNLLNQTYILTAN